jgi:hypothetical protein
MSSGPCSVSSSQALDKRTASVQLINLSLRTKVVVLNNCFYRINMSALVFGAVGTIGEGFATCRILAQIGFLASVRSQMNF